MANNTDLAGMQNSQDVTISNILLENLISMYDWGFYNKGGFYNIERPTAGAYGGSKSKLNAIEDYNYSEGEVWQSYRPNWVWATSASIGTPIAVTGVYIDDVFTSNCQIDYIEGRVILDTPVAVSSNVELSYSHKWLNVIPARGVSWFREIQQGASRVDDPSIEFYGSGNWAQLGRNRVPLPTLAIEVTPPNDMAPYQLGGGQTAHNNVIFHVITENDWECSNILDVVTYQNDRVITMYDPNKLGASGVSVYNSNNTLTEFGAASGTYPDLVEYFRYQPDCYIFDSRAGGITELSPNLYIGSVRCKTEVRVM